MGHIKLTDFGLSKMGLMNRKFIISHFKNTVNAKNVEIIHVHVHVYLTYWIINITLVDQ